MRTDELITATRRAAFIPDADPEYTDSVVADELNRTMANVFVRPVTTARAGYWLKHKDTASVANKSRYRLPYRACALERVEWGDSSGQFQPLTELAPAEIPQMQGDSSTTRTTPVGYYIEGDQVVAVPVPSDSIHTFRLFYYLRPSRLVTQQSSTLGGGTVRGQVTAVDTNARTITVNALPFDQELGTPAAITSANQLIDVVHPTGWYELSLVGAPQTIAGTTITVGGSDSMTDVEVGDFVRAAEQTDWPAISYEWHQTLADATAVRILMAKNMSEKAAALANKIGLTAAGERSGPGSDLARLQETLEPRVKNSPKKVIRRTGVIFGRTSYWTRS